MNIAALYDLLFQPLKNISTDSRKIKPGDIYFALRGEHFNGNDFADHALKSGASFAVVDDPDLPRNEKFILVENVLQTLQELSVYHRQQFSIPVIAITGTNGKTTTKELTNIILSQKYNTISTKGNLNNHIGVPVTLLSITRQTEIAIVEMGANHPGEIDFLCQLSSPGYGLITNVGKAHLEGFGSLEGVLQTKTELYRFLQTNNGIVFLNQDNDLLKPHAAGITQVTYGVESGNVMSAQEITADPFVRLLLRANGQEIHINSRLPGKYNAQNILAAACIGSYFGVDLSQIKSAVESYQPSNNRSQIIRTNKNRLLLDAYNANPSSMEQALTEFAGSWDGEKVLILGDMMELGTESDREHQAILELIRNKGFQEVYLVGSIFTRNNTERNWHCFQDSELATIWLDHHQIQNKTILIKGSRSVRLEILAEVL